MNVIAVEASKRLLQSCCCGCPVSSFVRFQSSTLFEYAAQLNHSARRISVTLQSLHAVHKQRALSRPSRLQRRTVYNSEFSRCSCDRWIHDKRNLFRQPYEHQDNLSVGWHMMSLWKPKAYDVLDVTTAVSLRRCRPDDAKECVLWYPLLSPWTRRSGSSVWVEMDWY